jgi:hypothetical protein
MAESCVSRQSSNLKEVISDFKRENQFLSKEIIDSIWLISRDQQTFDKQRQADK